MTGRYLHIKKAAVRSYTLRTAACYGGMGYGVISNCMKLLGAEAEGVGLVAVEDVAGVDFSRTSLSDGS